VHVMLPDYREDMQIDSMKPSDIRVMLLRRGLNIGRDIGAREWGEKQLTMQSLCNFSNFEFNIHCFR
jgi:hypothetical protein